MEEIGHIDLCEYHSRLLVYRTANHGVRHADKSERLACHRHACAVYGVLPCVSDLHIRKDGRCVFEVLAYGAYHVVKLNVESFLIFRAAVKRDTELFALVGHTVSVVPLDNSAYLKDAEGIRISAVLTNEGEKRGHHAVTEGCQLGCLRVEETDVIFNLNADLLIFGCVAPDVRVYLAEIVARYENILGSVVVGIRAALANGSKGRASGLYLKVIVAVDTGDLFDKVGGDGNVFRRSPGGNGNVKLVAVASYLKAERGKRVVDLVA